MENTWKSYVPATSQAGCVPPLIRRSSFPTYFTLDGTVCDSSTPPHSSRRPSVTVDGETGVNTSVLHRRARLIRRWGIFFFHHHRLPRDRHIVIVNQFSFGEFQKKRGYKLFGKNLLGINHSVLWFHVLAQDWRHFQSFEFLDWGLNLPDFDTSIYF